MGIAKLECGIVELDFGAAELECGINDLECEVAETRAWDSRTSMWVIITVKSRQILLACPLEDWPLQKMITISQKSPLGSLLMFRIFPHLLHHDRTAGRPSSERDTSGSVALVRKQRRGPRSEYKIPLSTAPNPNPSPQCSPATTPRIVVLRLSAIKVREIIH